jgi:hypothetical protein
MCIKVFFSLHDYIEMHGQKNLKKKSLAVARQTLNLAGPKWVTMQKIAEAHFNQLFINLQAPEFSFKF